MTIPEFTKTSEWEKYRCDPKSPDCGWSWEGYGWGLKKGAPEWLVKEREEYIRLDREKEKKGIL